MTGLWVAAGALVAASACSGAAPAARAPVCQPTPERMIAVPSTMVDHDDSFLVTLVADQGTRAGQQVSGRLDLVRNNDPTNPLIGWTDLDLSEVGAYELGSLESRDPERPGVRVFEDMETNPPYILLRLGSDANEEGVMVIEAARSVLHVYRLEDDAFYGRWQSGVERVVAAGYFCAVEMKHP